MRISDWSSDVCSSDLSDDLPLRLLGAAIRAARAGRLASIKRRHFRHGHRRVRIIWRIGKRGRYDRLGIVVGELPFIRLFRFRSEEHTSELQSLMRISYAVFCLKKKRNENINECTIR